MKSEKGITVISVTIYVIAMVLIVALIAVMTNYFYKNVDYASDEVDFNQQYTTINNFFSEEANLKDNKILEIGETINDEDGTKQIWVAFSSKNQYTYVEANKALYRNNVKIAKDIESFSVSQESKNRKTGI